MPKIVHPKDPAWTGDLETAIVAFGNRAHIEIIRYLNGHGPGRRGDIVDAVSASEASVALHLITLEDSGVIAVDTVRGRRHGRAPRYPVDINRVKELMDVLRDYLLNLAPTP